MQVIKKLLKDTLLFLMGIQILFGAVYMVFSMGSAQQFMESIRLFGLGEQFVSDGYTGILYSVLLWFCHILSGGGQALFANGITTIPFSAFISVFQLVMAAAATWYFLGVWMKHGWQKGICVAYLLTVPFLLQMHLSVLPWSLALSAVEVMLGGLLRVLSTAERRDILAMLLGYMAAGLIVIDLFWICGLFLLAALLFLCFKRNSGKALKTVDLDEKAGKAKYACRQLWLVFLLVSVAVFTINRVTYVAQNDRIQNSFQASMVSRFVWPNFATNYYFWSDEVKDAISLEDAVTICQREDALESFFGPVMEQKYGYEKAKSLYLQMAYQCFMDRTREEITMLAEDIKDYLLIPFTVDRNLSGDGTSLTAWNYGRMQLMAPQLVKYYVRYSLMVLPIMMLFSVIIVLSDFVKIRFNKWKYLVGFGVWYGLWFAMASNKPIDYKQVLPVLFLWYLIGICGVVDTDRTNECKIGKECNGK